MIFLDGTMKSLLLLQLDLHQKLYNNVLEGFSDAESNQRLHDNPQINHVKYLAGHLLNSQYGLAQLSGMEADVKWNDLFAAMNQSTAKDNFPYPHIEEIRDEWNRLYEPTRNGLSKMTEKDLLNIPPTPLDQVSKTVGDLWAFLNHHAAYHIGQIGLIRRGFGKPPMSYE